MRSQTPMPTSCASKKSGRRRTKKRSGTQPQANFPNVFIVEDDLLTPLDDPEDQNGDVPPPPTTVPCPEGDAKDAMDAAIDCVALKCNTLSPGDENGQTTSIDCAIDECLRRSPRSLPVPRCYACLATQLPTSTFAQIRIELPHGSRAGPGLRGPERRHDPLALSA